MIEDDGPAAPAEDPELESHAALRAAAVGGAAVIAVDIGSALLLRGLPAGAVPPVALAGLFMVSLVALLFGALGALALRPWAARLDALRARPRRRALFALSAAAALVALHLFNATFYARLYLSLHLGLTLAEVALATAAALVLLPAPRSARRALTTGALLAGAVAGLLGLGFLAIDTPTRSAAVETTTVTAHGLFVLEETTGVFSRDAADFDAALAGASGDDSDATPRFAPMPLGAPSGDARGANLVIVTVDALRHDEALGAYDTLGASSVRFSRAYAPACWTMHSMSATFTSRLPSQLSFVPVTVGRDMRLIPHDPRSLIGSPLARSATPVPLRDETPTLAGILRGAGYETFTVATYFFYLRDAGLTREFEHVDERAVRERALEDLDIGIVPVPEVARALEGLDARDTERPFFLWLHLMDPHAPYDGEAAGDERGRYRAEVERADAKIEALIAGLRARGLMERTIFVVHADHGEEFGDHGGRFHGTTAYDEQVRVQLLVHGPGVDAGEVGGEESLPVSLLDLTPTALDLLGVATDAPMVGRSLAPRLRGEALTPRPVATECRRFGRDRIAEVRWPLKRIVDRRMGTVELYDLERDPGERRNLAR